MIRRALLLLMLSSPALAAPLKLAYEPTIAPASATTHTVVVDLRIDRPADRGGDDINRLGTVRSVMGMPYALMVHKKKGPRLKEMWTRWLTETLAAAGVVDGTSDAQLKVVVEDFWIDGYMVYSVQAKVKLEVVKDGVVVWTKSMRGEETRALTIGQHELNKPINELLSSFSTTLVEALRTTGAQGFERAFR